MIEKFKKRYRIRSTRLPFHDYRSNGSYFVTICTKDKEPWFGEIQNGIMCLSYIGQMAHQYWRQIPDHFQQASFGSFIIMPDHIHGIINIDKTNNSFDTDLGRLQFADRVETYHDTSLHPPDTNQDLSKFYSKIAPKKHSLGSIVRGYKQTVTLNARKIDSTFRWQPRFYERVIRNQKEYSSISDYILLNPRNWK